MIIRRLLSQALLATLLGVAGGLVGAYAPASAAACVKGSGVTAVVDFNELGGGTRTACVPGSGGYADSTFDRAGIDMTYASQEPGFVCRVEGVPASAPCGKASSAAAYWSLWWSDGSSGTWNFASSGVGGLKLKTGSFVAWAWQKGSTKSAPSVTPVGPAPAPTKKPKPQPKPTKKPAKSSPTSKATPTPSPSPSTAAQKADAKKKAVKKKAVKKKAAEVKQSATPSANATTGQPATDDQIDKASAETSTGNGLIWAGGAIAVALLAGMGGMAWRRRSSGGLGS